MPYTIKMAYMCTSGGTNSGGVPDLPEQSLHCSIAKLCAAKRHPAELNAASNFDQVKLSSRIYI